MAAITRWLEFEHTADVGIGIDAGSLPEVFESAARGMLVLLMGEEQVEALSASNRGTERRLQLEATDAALLLADWLRQLLYWHDVDGLCALAATFRTLNERRLEATVRCVPQRARPLREIKGVTYHGLDVTRTEQGWHARVIFDV